MTLQSPSDNSAITNQRRPRLAIGPVAISHRELSGNRQDERPSKQYLLCTQLLLALRSLVP